MEDFLVFWEFFYSSPEFWNLEKLNLQKLESKISPSKLAALDLDFIQSRLQNLKKGISRVVMSSEIMDLLHQEYLSNHNNIIEVFNGINRSIEQGEDF